MKSCRVKGWPRMPMLPQTSLAWGKRRWRLYCYVSVIIVRHGFWNVQVSHKMCSYIFLQL